MTKADYEVYKANVAEFLKRNDCKAACNSPVHDNGAQFFSWRACECCHTQLGGTRKTYRFATEHGETFEADICVDCIYYLAYGQLDDLTMLEIDGGVQ